MREDNSAFFKEVLNNPKDKLFLLKLGEDLDRFLSDEAYVVAVFCMMQWSDLNELQRLSIGTASIEFLLSTNCASRRRLFPNRPFPGRDQKGRYIL